VRINAAGPREEDVDLALLAGDSRVEPIEIGEFGHVTLHAGDAPADQRHCFIQFYLAAPDDVDERTLFNEALGGGETHSAAAASDECNFSLELWHLNPLASENFCTTGPEGDRPGWLRQSTCRRPRAVRCRRRNCCRRRPGTASRPQSPRAAPCDREECSRHAWHGQRPPPRV